MKISNALSLVGLTVAFTLGFIGPLSALAATTPSLGQATSYGILSSTYTNTTSGTTVTGDVGFTTGPAVAPLGVHANYGSGAPYSQAGTDQGSALSALASQPCTYTFPSGAIDLSTDNQRPAATPGVFTPGVYCSIGAMDIGGPLTLSGSGTYIFRPIGALTSTTGSIVTLSGASACDVFWTPSAATSLAATTTFAGTVIEPTSSAITVGADTTWSGRALAFGGTVTTDRNVITVPATCSVAISSTGTGRFGRITVVKTVINDNGGTKTVADFPLFVNGLQVNSGVVNTFPESSAVYTVSETADSNYTRTFSGDCDTNGRLYVDFGSDKLCLVTNNDLGAPVVAPPVPPLIDLVKVPNPLALPAGPGPVTYTYTLRNIGTVPVSNITMVGDTCSPITLVSGDTNADSKLDLNETWTYRCSTTLSATHTNTVVATGWANGISAVDIASATVVVGVPVVPPLIHVTKIPSPLTLLAGGGMVIYTEKITNPGTVALNNVRLTDDKCSPVTYISGDTNGDSKLDTTETWTYTCQTNLTQATTNTAIASGEANGFSVRDFAIATVLVAVPALPNTGLPPFSNSSPWNIIILSLVFVGSLIYLIRKKQMV